MLRQTHRHTDTHTHIHTYPRARLELDCDISDMADDSEVALCSARLMEELSFAMMASARFLSSCTSLASPFTAAAGACLLAELSSDALWELTRTVLDWEGAADEAADDSSLRDDDEDSSLRDDDEDSSLRDEDDEPSDREDSSERDRELDSATRGPELSHDPLLLRHAHSTTDRTHTGKV